MANQFLTIKEVARQALPRLIENLVFPNLVYKDYSDTFQKRGDEIQIRKPAKLEAKEFDVTKGVEMQDIDDSQTVTVKLDKIATVDVEISALEGALNIDNLNRQFIEPAAVALAQKINSDGLALYKDIPYVCGLGPIRQDRIRGRSRDKDISARQYPFRYKRKRRERGQACREYARFFGYINAYKVCGRKAGRSYLPHEPAQLHDT